VSVFVVDASVAVKWFMPEIHTDAALRLRNSPDELIAPDFYILEVANVIAVKIRRGDLDREEGTAMLESFRRAPIHVYDASALLQPAFDLANETRRSLYDCLYLALAIQVDGQVVTADRKLYDAIVDSPRGRYLLWIEDL
jgi:predicted nucleic acid-binding protein